MSIRGFAVNKYKLRLDRKLKINATLTLYQIERLSDGELGGHIEKESNLAQTPGNAWVSGDAQVYGNAQVCGNARVCDLSHVVNFVIASKFSITVTPDNVTIGCELRTREDWLGVTESQAVEMGLPAKLYPHYRRLVETGMELVPSRAKLNSLRRESK